MNQIPQEPKSVLKVQFSLKPVDMNLGFGTTVTSSVVAHIIPGANLSSLSASFVSYLLLLVF